MEYEPTVFVVDDDESVRKSLRWLMISARLNVETYESAEKFLESYDPQMPGCLVLDICMPAMTGLELQEQLASKSIRLPVIIITGYGDVPKAIRAMKYGAFDFIEKPFDDQVLMDCVQKAIELDTQNRWEQSRRSHIESRMKRLTPRETEVTKLLVAGLGNKQVAYQLGISKKTVEIHRAHIMQKLGADSLVDVVGMVLTYKKQI